MDTYAIGKNLALTGALGYPKVSELDSIFNNQDVSAMLKLTSALPPGMDKLIRAERDRFAAMKAVGGVTGLGPLAHVHSVIDKLPKDLYPAIAMSSSLVDRFLSNKELRDLIFPATHGASPPRRSEAERRRAAFYIIDGGMNS
jgi:hypothetical protein